MKQWMLWMMAALVCLSLALPLTAWAEERKDYYGMDQAAKEAGDEALMAEIRAEMPSRLHAARDGETGLWGYINFLGEWVIPPRYEGAWHFRGNYAAVSTGDPWDYTTGIIDRDGNWVVEPEYFFDEGYDGWEYGGLDTGMYLVWNRDEADEMSPMGFFDVRSGYFSGLKYGWEMTWYSDADLAPMPDYDEETDQEVAVYLSRSTGDEKIRLTGYSVDWLMHTSEFYNGFAMIYQEAEDRDYIINEQGEILDIPDTLVFYGADVGIGEQYYACGLLLCYDTETGLYGYWDLNAGDWRVPPRYAGAGPFSASGYACVKTGDDSWGHIDPQGNLLADGFSGNYEFKGEYAYVWRDGILINGRGETALAFAEGRQPQLQWDDELNDEFDYYVSPEGLIEVSVEGAGTGVMNLDGDWILPPDGHYVYMGEVTFAPEGWRFFSEGLQAVARRGEIVSYRTVNNVYTGTYEEPVYEWKVGYINARGEWVIPCVYDAGGAFLDGLAWVERGEECGYIDAFGHEIYFWKE